MKQRLALFRPAFCFAFRTILPDLCDVTTHGAPAFDLSLVVRTTAAHVIPAVPLKPTARIFVIDPAILLPDRERLRGVHLEEIELRIVLRVTKFRFMKPRSGEFFAAISAQG